MRRSGRTLLLAVLVVATAAAGCGDAGDGPDGPKTAATASATTTETTSEAARARRALVRLADLPSGWVEQAGVVTRLRCGSFEPFDGASAIVRSKRLTHDRTGVQERIALYPDVQAARRALRRLDSRTAAGCLRRELRRHVSEEAGGPAGPATLVRHDELGPTANARRYMSTAISSFGKVIGYIDAVHKRDGRALVALVIVSGPQPLEEALYDRVVARVSERLRSSLG